MASVPRDMLLDLFHGIKFRQKFKKPTCKHPNQQDYLVCLAGMSESDKGNEDIYLEYTEMDSCYTVPVNKKVMRSSRYSRCCSGTG